jgi:hypothetical protein
MFSQIFKLEAGLPSRKLAKWITGWRVIKGIISVIVGDLASQVDVA